VTPIPITVVIPVRNEERNLPRCLQELDAFAEVVVVDSSSTDRTRQIAEGAGAKVINFAWQGGFPKKRSWVLLTYRFSTDWVLFLDADEQLTEASVQEMRSGIADRRYVGFWLNYTNHFLGCVLRFGVPQRKLALMRVGAGLFERIDDANWSDLDMEVHEHPVLEGAVGEIRAPIDHADFRGLHHFVARHNAYSTWEANRYAQMMSNPAACQHFSKRQRMKYRFMTQWWFPFAYFLFTYIVRGGFLDGRAGFVYAAFKADYFLQIQEKIAELKRPTLRCSGADHRYQRSKSSHG
jgi:glycosyltransferase involved in cell wall biosynthesis